MSYFRPRIELVLGPLLLAIGWALLTLNYSADTTTRIWFVAHFFLVSGALLATVPVLELWQISKRSLPVWVGNALGFITLLGLFLLASQFVIDMVVWLRSASAEEMNLFFDTLQGHTPIRAAFYTAGPGLFFVGLVVYAGLLGRRLRRLLPAAFMIGGAAIVIVVAHLLNWHPLFSLLGYLVLLGGFAGLGRTVT